MSEDIRGYYGQVRTYRGGGALWVSEDIEGLMLWTSIIKPWRKLKIDTVELTDWLSG